MNNIDVEDSAVEFYLVLITLKSRSGELSLRWQQQDRWKIDEMLKEVDETSWEELAVELTKPRKPAPRRPRNPAS